ncbi:type III secretion system stator protein SctL [Pseudomonas sp. AMR01]|uniref:type III secretion system stator protein SctL n=1 Tax=Pseudomonas sp. AMR01 TaxID=3064904 RepID=UPI0035C11EF4
MLCRRKIDLHNGSTGQATVLITQEMLKENAQASQLLERAHARADQLLSEAAAQCEVLLEQANQAFWQQANAQLEEWAHQRQMMCDNLERYATSIADQALCCLLEDIPPTQRLTALIKRLMAAQLPTVSATLLCHPSELASLEQCLALLDITLWVLRADDAVKPQALVLETTEGDFRIDWASMRKILLVREDPFSAV